VHRLTRDLREASLESITVRRLSVPLVEPFVIASGAVQTTQAVEVEACVRWRGRTAIGLGEAACLPPVTRETQDDVLRELGEAASPGGRGFDLAALDGLGPVARAGLQTAVLDAMARLEGVPLRAFLDPQRGSQTATLETDVTVAIADPPKMAALARAWVERGFRSLKVKVGKDVDTDIRALEAIARAAPRAKLRVDANAGYTPAQAIALARACERIEVPVECWEQPCAADDLDGMAQVAAELAEPVVADESVKTLADLRAIVARKAADGVNLKLAKLGGMDTALAVGVEAQKAGLKIMVGGMVETRLGMTAAAHLACALGGAEFVDLDTAWLLATDPYVGGYVADGPRYSMPGTPGLAIGRRAVFC
jgi:L-alanine-DL-glutamate epimerase-like enolase superfamily enzyme